jgi:hypothetical protein
MDIYVIGVVNFICLTALAAVRKVSAVIRNHKITRRTLSRGVTANSEANSMHEDYTMRIQKTGKCAAKNGVWKKVAGSIASPGRWFSLAVALLLLLPALTAYGQFESATVLGYAKDASGAAIANTTVTLTNTATGITQTAKTDAEGRYEFASVPIGTYTVKASAQSFEPTQTEPFMLQTDARQRVDLALKAGAVTDQVTVTEAPSQLETETSSQGQVIGTREVENLPLNGRSYADLVLLVPGARKSFLENQTASSREGSFNINGQRSAFNNYLLDGLDNNNYGTSNQGFANENIPPSPDAVNEFKVETDNYSAEFGRSTGAVINVSTRRGTNQYHGKAYDYLRNTDLNAIGPFCALPPGVTSGSCVKTILIKNQFGGTFGGPVIKDKLFLFGDYEGLRQIFTNSPQAVTLPDAEQRQGLFLLHRVDGSTAPIPLYNPVTAGSFTNGNIAPQATKFGLAVLAALPGNTSPIAPGNFSNNYVATPRGLISDDKGDIRGDYIINQKWSVFGRYSQHATVILDPPTVTGRAGGNANSNVNIRNKQIAGGVTYVLSQNKLLDFRMAWTQNYGAKTPYGQGDSSLLTENGITDGIPTDPFLKRDLNAQSINGFTQLGAQPASPQFQNPTIYDPKANFTYVHGRQSMKFGYEYEMVGVQINDYNPSYGQDNYASAYSTGPSTTVGGVTTPFYATCATPASTGCVPTDTASGNSASTQIAQARAVADFLFGNRSSYSLTNYVVKNLRQQFNFLYFQDDFKVSPSLTINAGLRYEIVTPQYERDNRLANFNPATNTLVQAGTSGINNRALVNIRYNNFAPRFGFAYSYSLKTVVRGGYAVAYTQTNRAGGENNLTYNGPDVVNAAINNPSPFTTGLCTSDTQDQTACFRQTQQGYSNVLTSSAYFVPSKVTSRYIPPNFQTGYVQSYNLGVEQQMPGGVVLGLAYVGNKGTHLQVLADYNQAAPCLVATVAACTTSYQNRRPVPTFGDIEIAYGGNSSSYNSLQFKAEKRVGALYVLNSFTYSRTFDLASGHLETSNGDNSRVNFANPRNDYGPSGYDQPLADTTSIVYDLPYGHGRHFGKNSNFAMNELLGGWQLTTINTMTSGLPFNLNYSTSSSSGTLPLAPLNGAAPLPISFLFTSDLATLRPQHISGTELKLQPSERVKKATSLSYLPSTTNNGVLAYDYPSYSLYGNTSGYGNVSRNSGRSYAFYQTDLGLHKAFALWREGANLDFRAEAFNVLNKVNYQAPDSNISDGGFGTITSNYPPRQLQLALKLIF